MKRLMIMAAGTGGHIFPGIAIAQTMKNRGWDVTWLGTAHGLEMYLVPFVASTTSHQRDNAQWMAQQQAAIHLPQQALNAQDLAHALQSLTRAQCQAMAQAAHTVGRRDANDAIAAVLEQLAAGKHK